MSSISKIAFCLVGLFMTACVEVPKKINPEVDGFMQLLVRVNEPTLSEHSKYSGECGGESELEFVLEECLSKGWDIDSEQCVKFSRDRCLVPEQEQSMELRWLRKRFSTVGKKYQLLNVESKTDAYEHALVEVGVGENIFLLFYNADPTLPTGILIGVYKVNGKSVSDYMKTSD